MDIKKQLLELILRIDRNESAHDDDLERTFDSVEEQINVVKKKLEQYLKQGKN